MTGTGNGLVLSGWSDARSFRLVFRCAGDRVMESYFSGKAFASGALLAVCTAVHAHTLRVCVAFAGEVCC